MADLVSGEGRTGRAGLVSELKVLIKDTVGDSGVTAALATWPEPRRRMLEF